MPGDRFALLIAISAGDFAPPSCPNQLTPTTTHYIRTGRDLNTAPFAVYLQAGRCAGLLVIQARPILQTQSLLNIHLLLLTLQAAPSWLRSRSWPEATSVLSASRSFQRGHTNSADGVTIVMLTRKSSTEGYQKAVTSVVGCGERIDVGSQTSTTQPGRFALQRTPGRPLNQSREGS